MFRNFRDFLLGWTATFHATCVLFNDKVYILYLVVSSGSGCLPCYVEADTLVLYLAMWMQTFQLLSLIWRHSRSLPGYVEADFPTSLPYLETLSLSTWLCGGRFSNFSPLCGDRHSTFQLAVLLVNGCNILGCLVCFFVIKRQFLIDYLCCLWSSLLFLSWLGHDFVF